MKPNAVAAAAARPNRVLMALAAAWMILSLAIGGAVSAKPAPEAGAPAQAAVDEAAHR